MRHGARRGESDSPLTVLPQPEHEDGVLAIDVGGVWPKDVVRRLNWKLARLSSNLIAGESREALEGVLDEAV